MKHYIVIEVRETSDRKHGTDAGDIRRVLHKYAKEREFNIADMIFREDRTELYNGQRNPYPEIRNIFEAVMISFKESMYQWNRRLAFYGRNSNEDNS